MTPLLAFLAGVTFWPTLKRVPVVERWRVKRATQRIETALTLKADADRLNALARQIVRQRGTGPSVSRIVVRPLGVQQWS